jgi:adenine/guanine phosphoribosyltransferase-like PRPP-binding protein
VVGQHILVVEDLWVSGTSAASTAGALLDAGAEAIAVVPIARVVETPYWDQQGHPYTEVLMDPSRKYDIEIWPRGS